MKRLLQSISMILIAGLISCPVVDAQGRTNNSNQRSTQTQQQRSSVSSSNQRTTTQSNQRTSNQSNQRTGTQSNQRTGTQSNQRTTTQSNQRTSTGSTDVNNQRSGNSMSMPSNSGSTTRPGKTGTNNTNNQRPGTSTQPGNNVSSQRPGTNVRPGNAVRPGTNVGVQRSASTHAPVVTRPATRRAHWGNIHFGAPYRPLMPAVNVWNAPVRPAYIPVGGPVISTILGVALGTAINLTVNSLINNGYNVTAYGDNAVYVQDAMQLGLLWPNATLYYENGGLYASEFVYSTPYADMQRYNTVYNTLINSYGTPYSSTNSAGTLTTTWWGNGGQFVQLQYTTASSVEGGLRYYTILSFGN